MWTRRQALGGIIASGLTLASRHATGELPEAQSTIAITPPNGIVLAKPRLQGIRRVIPVSIIDCS